ncbi:aspartate aminotransferase, cytoplasmic, putative [Anopheles sinensis]|uniref:Aspartate aminotransferase, cytoplasmic, putative n=1 Tax=Anopheles sinensis TaxID=74873 RepID=A0A084WNL9_ANOSI|nr:aspartate aminotransferase, cytoplasmic, putative [Anopheles sinensis]
MTLIFRPSSRARPELYPPSEDRGLSTPFLVDVCGGASLKPTRLSPGPWAQKRKLARVEGSTKILDIVRAIERRLPARKLVDLEHEPNRGFPLSCGVIFSNICPPLGGNIGRPDDHRRSNLPSVVSQRQVESEANYSTDDWQLGGKYYRHDPSRNGMRLEVVSLEMVHVVTSRAVTEVRHESQSVSPAVRGTPDSWDSYEPLG